MLQRLSSSFKLGAPFRWQSKGHKIVADLWAYSGQLLATFVSLTNSYMVTINLPVLSRLPFRVLLLVTRTELLFAADPTESWSTGLLCVLLRFGATDVLCGPSSTVSGSSFLLRKLRRFGDDNFSGVPCSTASSSSSLFTLITFSDSRSLGLTALRLDRVIEVSTKGTIFKTRENEWLDFWGFCSSIAYSLAYFCSVAFVFFVLVSSSRPLAEDHHLHQAVKQKARLKIKHIQLSCFGI
jgi:hypothetical protein